jgi:hypothetical protein
MFAVAALLVMGGPALAQSQGAGDNAGSSSHAGGSSVSGTSSSSSSISTSGGADVGVVQGNVSAGSTASGNNNGAGDQSGSSTGGDGVGGQVSGVADAPNAAQDGVVSQLDLPAVGTADDATPAGRTSPSVVMWALAALLVAGLFMAYRRLPRPTSA